MYEISGTYVSRSFTRATSFSGADNIRRAVLISSAPILPFSSGLKARSVEFQTYFSSARSFSPFVSGANILSCIPGLLLFAAINTQTTEIVQNQRETIIDFSGLRTSTIVTKFGFNDYTKNTGIWDVSYWVKKSSTEIHAIRYLGTMFCSAWKYVMSGNQQTIYATLIDPIGPEDAADLYDRGCKSV